MRMVAALADGTSERVEVVVIGAGIAGSALATALARAGRSVLVLERATEYRDRVRGEWIAPWGVVETRRLGLYETLVQAGGHHVRRHVGWDETISPAESEALAIDLTTLVPDVPGPLCLGHPTSCRALAAAARAGGARIVTGVAAVRITAGASPSVVWEADGVVHRTACRLIVGADGRTSAVRQQTGIALHRDPPHHLFGGLLAEDLDWPDDTEAIGTDGDVHYLVFPQGAGRARLYLGFALEQRQRFAGADGAREFLRAFRLPCLPFGEQVARARPAGPCAAFANEDAWTDEPFTTGVVLVGDAAGWNDPIIGQGISISMRDVRIVSELLLGNDEWSPALFAPYADERRERLRRLRFSASLNAHVWAEFSPEAKARRVRFRERVNADGTLLLALVGAAFMGPETVPAPCFDDAFRERLLGSVVA